MIPSLSPSDQQVLERKRRLGPCSMTWEEGRVVLEGPDAPKSEP